MLKSMFLSSVRLPVFAPDDPAVDTRTEAQKQRDSIRVESSKPKEPVEKEEAEETEVEIETETNKEETDDETDDDKEKDEDKEPKELTAEQKEIESLKKKVARLERRAGKTAGERDQIRKELNGAKASLAAKVEEGQGLSEEEVERRSDLKAEAKAAEIEFNNVVKKLVKDATKIDKDFSTKVKELAENIAPVPGHMIGILEDLDNGAAVFAHLADNEELYEELYELPMTKMASRLSKLGDKLAEEAKPKTKLISKVPPPIEAIRGGSESPNVLSNKPNKDSASMEKFVKQRQAQVEARRKAKFA